MASPTLLRDDDGAMYFIPPQDLESYRVPDDKAREIEAKLKASEESEVSGFAFDQNLTPQKLGLDNPSAATMDNSPTKTGTLF